MALEEIYVKGAEEHNLKNIDVKIPRNKMVVITGVSGSGKSSLAFDTIYAEGQRRYVESLSAYARQFLQMMQKPKVESIEGLSPAISIEQKTTSKNPRSIVATTTEIYDYMRVLWSRVGIPYSPATGLPIIAQTPQQIVQKIMELPEKTRFYILAPIARERKGEYKTELSNLRKKGFQRVIIDGENHTLDEIPELDKKKKHTIEVLVDRLVLKSDMGNRLTSSIETALELSGGLVYLDIISAETKEVEERQTFSALFSCPESGFTIEEIEPRLFSFNSPVGACPTCSGLGTTEFFNPDLIVPDQDVAMNKGAIDPWNTSHKADYDTLLFSILEHYGLKRTTKYKDLPDEVKDVLLYGTKEKINIKYNGVTDKYSYRGHFEGIVSYLERRLKYSRDFWMRDYAKKYISLKPCETCDGLRLKTEALSVKINKNPIAEITQLSIRDAYKWFKDLPEHLTEQENKIAALLLKEITSRLHFLEYVGLDYLNLSRSVGTLSGGESQRIRLASQIGSGLTGVLYVLDEPSIGLHQKDNQRLLDMLARLRDLGNTVLIVEHDEDAMRSADHVIDMGPLAGIHGGEVVAEGTYGQICKNKNSLTGQYLSGIKTIPIPRKIRKGNGKKLQIQKAHAHNLKNVDVSFPLGTFTCVTGVSGSGKSTMTVDILYKAAAQHFYKSREIPSEHKAIKGFEHLDKVIDIDQSPIGRTPRSNPATYTGVFGPIRDWFAGLPEAQARGYKPGRFSFNVKGGRCESCQGDGVLKVEMHFLADVYVTCDECQGKRYNDDTLAIKYKGKSISDVLEMTIEEGVTFFENIPTIKNKLETLYRVGVGYMKIGQQATTMSGGEAQRVKLAKELSKKSTGQTLYILDEPTTGLHFDDVKKLLEILHELVDQGNTVLVIEHNLDVIKTADWLIDLGPDGGDRGGEIVFSGPPQKITSCGKSYTGQYLKPYFEQSSDKKTA